VALHIDCKWGKNVLLSATKAECGRMSLLNATMVWRFIA
jgi:hypothetical protein